MSGALVSVHWRPGRKRLLTFSLRFFLCLSESNVTGKAKSPSESPSVTAGMCKQKDAAGGGPTVPVGTVRP